jgi:dihydrodipicolinate synthase/N-acetylneuraminate lyase
MSHGSHQILQDRLRGVLAFPITPFAEDGSIDLPAICRNAAWLPDTGVATVVAPSGTSVQAVGAKAAEREPVRALCGARA